MRMRNLIGSEFRFLWKYGIIAVYCVFTIFYLCVLAAIPESARSVTSVILIYTDPAAMGMFFMGAVVLLEKSQRVESSLAVSPIKLYEYITAKVIPMMVVGCIVAVILAAYAKNYSGLTIIGVGLASILFSLCGLSIGSNIKSLNGFLVMTIPFELVLCLPAILYLFNVIESGLWMLHPGVAAIRLISGEYQMWYLCLLSIVIWSIPVFILCKRLVRKSFISMGGAKI